MESKELAREIVKILDRKKGADIKVVGIAELTVLADYFVIVTGTSNTHIRSLADEVEEVIKTEKGLEPRSIEGKATGWILIDYVDVVLHIFTGEAREYYKLENLWTEGALLDISDIVTD